MIVMKHDCPFDGPYGQIGFRLCSDGKTIILMCDECDAVWMHPEEISVSESKRPQPPDYIVPGTDYSISSPNSRWATREEIEKRGWEQFIVGGITR